MTCHAQMISRWCLGLMLGFLTLAPAHAQDLCPATDPNSWPARRVPYVLVIADTSASMTTSLGVLDSCGYGTDRRSHQRCALDRTFKTFTGQIDFSVMTFATAQLGCNGNCYLNCVYNNYPGNADGNGCGPEPNPTTNSATRRGGVIQVPFQGSATPQSAVGNFPSLRGQVDNQCSNQQELFASGSSPLNGALRDAFRYFSNQWVAQDNSVSYATPLTSVAAGELPCRPLRVILLTDSDDNCDTMADVVDAAADLQAGFALSGINWRVRTHVIALAANSLGMDQVAAAGGTTVALVAANETGIVSAMGSILHPLVGSEVADNADNNCNGCVDEGYGKYANIGQSCCSWATPAQRTTCLNNYRASITPANPQGNRALLPCTSSAEQADPLTWLTYNPGEICDNIDNNGVGGVDEGMLKCGNPLQCPSAEVCDGVDNNCNGLIDDGNVCSGCSVQPEICDGCDNDCDNIADEGAPSAPCGLIGSPQCSATATCRPQQPVPSPGACVANGGYGSCPIVPQAEVCDGVDNNCNGAVDESLPAADCVPNGAPGGIVFGGTSQCRMGTQACGDSVCRGFVGPTPEVSDDLDNDCDGLVNEGIEAVFRNGFE